MRSSISHPILHDFEGIRSYNPTKLLCFSSPKTTQCTRGITSPTGGSSREELNRIGTLLVNPTTATPPVG